MKLHMNKPKNILRKEDCEAIAKLLESGFSIKDALVVLKEKENEKAFDEIMHRLNNGESLHTFFYLYCPKSYVVLFEGMSQCMPFLDSLLTCIEMHQAIEKSQKQIIDGMLYPTLLFLGMAVGMYLFNALILPNMITLLMGFQLETNHLLWMHKAIQWIAKLLLWGIVLLFLIVMTALEKKHIVNTYCFVAKRFPDSILVHSVSAMFARFFLECLKRNVSTQNTLHILSQVKQQPCVSYIAKEIDGHLMQGETLIEAIQKTHIEKALLRFLKIAVFSSSSEEMLKGYLQMVEIRKQQAIKRYSTYIQLISYSLIAIVLIFVYQILMMPMTMLQNL